MNTNPTKDLDPIPSTALVAAVRAVLDLDPDLSLQRKAAVIAALTAPTVEEERQTGRAGEWEPLAEVAERVGVHRMSAYRYVNSRKIPSRTEGRGTLIREKDLRAFVESHPHHLRGPAPTA